MGANFFVRRSVIPARRIAPRPMNRLTTAPNRQPKKKARISRDCFLKAVEGEGVFGTSYQFAEIDRPLGDISGHSGRRSVDVGGKELTVSVLKTHGKDDGQGDGIDIYIVIRGIAQLKQEGHRTGEAQYEPFDQQEKAPGLRTPSNPATNDHGENEYGEGKQSDPADEVGCSYQPACEQDEVSGDMRRQETVCRSERNGVAIAGDDAQDEGDEADLFR